MSRNMVSKVYFVSYYYYGFFFFVSCCIICNILFISLGLSVEVGLLNSKIFGFIVSVCVIEICCC